MSRILSRQKVELKRCPFCGGKAAPASWLEHRVCWVRCLRCARRTPIVHHPDPEAGIRKAAEDWNNEVFSKD